MKIVLEKQKCIGCGTCQAICPEFFELGEDGKSHLKDSKFDAENEKEEVEVAQADCAQEAAEACPVKCIRILNEK